MKDIEMKKTSMGRKKIEISKIKLKKHLQVTFSKRRGGLFKKASELCILCGVEIAVIVFSPAGKLFSFGHSSVNSIVDRFLASQNFDPPLHNVDGNGFPHVNMQQKKYIEILNQLEAEKRREEKLAQSRNTGDQDFVHGQCWWNSIAIDDFGLYELEQLKSSLEGLKEKINKRVDELLMEAFL
ncbi:PREDICTED: agamous-like MADS-box protein AGL62 [Nelumbo nucifera]|uniref:MADS-box domain-containing protein n=2 Tax=Nelumbo nucifera TaxID=4432 RepID=A0A822XSF7_NELNU|nr:PREDICTED: agamous-like MADS-box protein AGL62 [Nelumbo nucifera]DAD24534.1 TPA_asm: hypothetical protein HUJ06_025998 [Nelumbo nucifera]